jgi:H+/Cl- antiporter ClcA
MTKPPRPPEELADFTTTPRVIPMAGLAVVIGAVSAVVAFALLRLIGLFTNLFFFQRWDTSFSSPAANTLGVLEVFVPVAGALIVGLIARYGSERVRGHGIPEALEAILIRGSRVEPRVAVLKPISAAISIGSGGPFGAEGPIIMTGGAFGSMIAQLFHLTSAERKTLLVAGAAAGMAATFSAPIASVLLAVELLLFEIKPRSVIPVALACSSAMLVRSYILGPGPLFPMPPHVGIAGPAALAGCVVLGLLVGGLSALMTVSVYFFEDLFARLPIHWMWWPAIGGLVVGLGGLVYPGALGVGYDTIGALLHGALPVSEVLLLVIVKWTIWAVFLGSGTSGGVLAPLLMIGTALGGIVGQILPAEGAGFWPLAAMGAILGGTMRSPLTGIIFAMELTGDMGMLVPLLVTTIVAHGFSVLVLRRSILTEKVARRGYHVTREYAIDPLDVLFVRDVMHTNVTGLAATATPDELKEILHARAGSTVPLYPVVDAAGGLSSVVTRRDLSIWVKEALAVGSTLPVVQVGSPGAVTAFDDELLRTVVQRMAATGRTRLPVIERGESRRLLGMVTLTHMLKARQRHVEEEQRRERVLPLRVLVPGVLRSLWR